MRTIVHISDLHFGALDAPVAEALVPYLTALRPDLVVVSGDLTQRARPAQFAEAMAYLRRLPGPQLVVPGNHDVPMWAFWERLATPLGRYRQHATRELSPVWEDDELLVLGVATPRPFVPVHDGFWKDGRITGRQLQHLVHHAKKDKACVVVTHHPFVPAPGTRRGGTVLHGREVLSLLARHGVDVLLAGHLHASYHAEVPVEEGRSILSVQAGTATSSRRRHKPEAVGGGEYPNAFNVLRVSRERVEIEVHAWLGDRGWTPAGRDGSHQYDRDGDRWRCVPR